MKIFQLSDIHLANEDEKPNEVDVRKNFLEIIEQVKFHRPNFLVLSGDLCFKESNRRTYRWIRSVLEAAGPPFFVLPGNHDDSILIQDIFHPEFELPEKNKFYFNTQLGKETAFFLDSGDGCIGSRQLDWLQSRLNTYPKERIIIFMHHPPAICGVPHMDLKHSLQDLEAFQEIIFSLGKDVHIFCGHYHTQLYMQLNNMHIYISPAGFYQMDRTYEKFVIEHSRPGYNIIDLENDRVSSHSHIII